MQSQRLVYISTSINAYVCSETILSVIATKQGNELLMPLQKYI